MARGESMKCIAVVDSDHSLMNFKLFGERGGAYRVDIDDATAKEKEKEYYTLHDQQMPSRCWNGFSLRKKELPAESTNGFLIRMLEETERTMEQMIYDEIWSFGLPVYQKMDGAS